LERKFSRFLTFRLLGLIGVSLTLVVGSLYSVLSNSMIKEYTNELKVRQSEVSMALKERFTLLETFLKETSLNNAIRVNLMLGVKNQLSEIMGRHQPLIPGARFFIQEKGSAQFIPELPEYYNGLDSQLKKLSLVNHLEKIRFQNYIDDAYVSIFSCPIKRKDDRLGTIYAIYNLSLDDNFWKRFNTDLNERLMIFKQGKLIDLHTAQSINIPTEIHPNFMKGFGSPIIDLFKNESIVGFVAFPELFYTVSSTPIHQKKQFMLFQLIALCVLIFCLTLLVSYHLIKRISEPLEVMADEALKISKKPSNSFLSENNIQYEEFRKLVKGFNQVLMSLFDAQKELNRQAEKKLEASEELYRRTLEAAPDAITISRRIDGRFLQVNETFCQMSGYSREESLGKSPFDLNLFYNPSDRDFLIKTLREKGKINGIECRFQTKDGTIIDTLLSARNIKFKEKECLISVASDITELKRAEAEKNKLKIQLQQAHKMEAIGTLAGGIAHDFNNILGIIIGNTELAKDHVPKSSPAYLNLREIQTSSLRAKNVVKQLLSFARKRDYERKPIKINPIIKESIQLLRVTIPTTIDFHQHIDAKADTVLADPTQINQVIINLCTNASYAMEENGGILEIRTQDVILNEASPSFTPDMVPGRYVNITVRDTGCGISPEILDRIFDPYFTTKDVGKGTGMGLAVVHGIVESHGGTITVKSQIAKGTTFSILLPVVENLPSQKAELVENLPTGSERILLVDDDPSMANVVRCGLERMGYQVDARTSSVDALELFRNHSNQFDLVITDMTMPQMTGDQLVKEILKVRSDIPTILCTGFSEKIDEEKSKKLGFRKYIEKPIDRRNLAMLVRQALDEKEAAAFFS